MSDSLRDLVLKAAEIENLIIDAGGELTPEIESQLMVVDEKLPQKIDGYAEILARMGLLQEHYKKKSKEMSLIAKACEKIGDFLTKNIKEAMERMGSKELLGDDVKFRLQNSQASVIIESEDLIPANYKTVTQVVSVDKSRVKIDLEHGVPVPGARLVQGTHIKQYLNTRGKK